VALDGQREPLRYLHQFEALHVRLRDVRRLRPRAAEHHRHAPLRVVAGGIVVAADLLAWLAPEPLAEEFLRLDDVHAGVQQQGGSSGPERVGGLERPPCGRTIR
jgi:hypothetical protein